MSFHGFPKYVLLILFLILFCAVPAFAGPAQSRLLADLSRPAMQPDISEKYTANCEGIFAVPGQVHPAIESLKEYISAKQRFFSERTVEKGTWSISPLLDNHTSSHFFADVPIGVVVKLRY